VKTRNLAAIRSFYDKYQKEGLCGAERFSEMAYNLSGVRYAVMTNIPFDSVRNHFLIRVVEFSFTSSHIYIL
jgi:hypothetical protein